MRDQLVSPGRQLRRAVEGATIAVPGAPNALFARMIEEAGFPAVYLSGAALSAAVLARPDVGFITLTELAQQTAYLRARINIPIIVDADTGFGDPIHMSRTIQELEAAGAAAIQLEDQKTSKRCGHLPGKTLVDTVQMCEKISAAASSRYDADLVIIARTDARGVEGFDAAVRRAEAYLDAGADWIFPEALESQDEFASFVDEIDAPLVANMTEFGRSPLLTMDELAELGYAAVLFPVTLLRIAARAVEASLSMIAEEGTQRELIDLMMGREQLYQLLDYQPLNGTHFDRNGMTFDTSEMEDGNGE